MRPIVMFNHVTADGFFASPDGKLDWVVPDEEIDREAASNPGEFDTMLFGRKTYEMFASFWPKAAESAGAAPDPHEPGRKSPAILAMAKWINETPKIVFSRTLKSAPWNRSRIIQELDPREIEAMKKQPGKGMIIFGSGSIVKRLTEEGLIDEYRFIVAPTLLGSGRTLFGDVKKKVPLKLEESKAYPSGNIKLGYARGEREETKPVTPS